MEEVYIYIYLSNASKYNINNLITESACSTHRHGAQLGPSWRHFLHSSFFRSSIILWRHFASSIDIFAPNICSYSSVGSTFSITTGQLKLRCCRSLWRPHSGQGSTGPCPLKFPSNGAILVLNLNTVFACFTSNVVKYSCLSNFS